MTIAKTVELSAQSTKSFAAAIDEGLDRAGKTIDRVRSAWIKDQQVDLADDGTKTYRVNMKVTFVVKD